MKTLLITGAIFGSLMCITTPFWLQIIDRRFGDKGLDGPDE